MHILYISVMGLVKMFQMLLRSFNIFLIEDIDIHACFSDVLCFVE